MDPKCDVESTAGTAQMAGLYPHVELMAIGYKKKMEH